jgi:hypothetical protein
MARHEVNQRPLDFADLPEKNALSECCPDVIASQALSRNTQRITSEAPKEPSCTVLLLEKIPAQDAFSTSQD